MSKTPEQVAKDALELSVLHVTTGTADKVVSALREAGWLRSWPWIEGNERERIETLTRERDEARKQAERWQEEARTYALNADHWRMKSESSAASPEVLGELNELRGWKRDVLAVCSNEAARYLCGNVIGSTLVLRREIDTHERKLAAENAALHLTQASPETLRVVEALLADMTERPSAWGASHRTLPTWNALRNAAHALAASRQPKAQDRCICYCIGNEVMCRVGAEHSRLATFYGPDSSARAEAECARLNAEAE